MLDGDEWQKMEWSDEIQKDFNEYCMEEPAFSEQSDFRNCASPQTLERSRMKKPT